MYTLHVMQLERKQYMRFSDVDNIKAILRGVLKYLINNNYNNNQ